MADTAPTPAPAPAPAPQQQQQNVTYVVYQMPAPAPAPAEIKIDWSNCFTFYVLRTAIMLALWAAWVVYIAGVAKGNQNCTAGLMPTCPYPGVIALYSQGLEPTSAGDCVRYFALDWWSVFLQMTTVLAVTATTLSLFAKSSFVKGVFTTTLYFNIMSSVLMFFIADKNNNAVYLNVNKIDNPSSNWTASCSLELVGTIVSLCLNFIYLIWNSYDNITDKMPRLPAAGPAAPAAPTPTVDAFVAPAEGAKAESA